MTIKARSIVEGKKNLSNSLKHKCAHPYNNLFGIIYVPTIKKKDSLGVPCQASSYFLEQIRNKEQLKM